MHTKMYSIVNFHRNICRPSSCSSLQPMRHPIALHLNLPAAARPTCCCCYWFFWCCCYLLAREILVLLLVVVVLTICCTVVPANGQICFGSSPSKLSKCRQF